MTNIIAGHELTPGKTVKDHIHVHGTELHVPHVLLCGMEEGPTALISAGIHNAEYVGIPSVLIERGQLSLFSREEIEADKADVRNILRRIGILPGDYTTYEKQSSRNTATTRPAPAAGTPKSRWAIDSGRARSWARSAIISGAASSRSSRPATGC